MTVIETNPEGTGGNYAPRQVGVVAPAWLSEALLVLLQSVPNIELWSSALTVEELLAENRPAAPNIVLIHGEHELDLAYEQVTQVHAAWPEALILILVDHINQYKVLTDAGAKRVLLKGVSPRRLIATLCECKSIVEYP